jgi:hypothetical protein
VLAREIEKLGRELSVEKVPLAEVEARIAGVREKLSEIDTMTWSERNVTGAENHRWLVGSSDMLGDMEGYGKAASEFILSARRGRASRGYPSGTSVFRRSSPTFMTSSKAWGDSRLQRDTAPVRPSL